jgi:hypothetical protein
MFFVIKDSNIRFRSAVKTNEPSARRALAMRCTASLKALRTIFSFDRLKDVGHYPPFQAERLAETSLSYY